jgi:hypothetical protein
LFADEREPFFNAIGHKQTPRHRFGKSASPLKADMRELTSTRPLGAISGNSAI